MPAVEQALLLVLDPYVIAVILVASVFGLVVGALPGLTATMATALLVPITFFMAPVPAIGAIVAASAMAIFAGDISGTLLRIPGTPASAAYVEDAYRMTGNRRDAEDLAQEAFLRAFRAFDRFDPERPLRPWLKRIAANLCLNWLQSSRIQTTSVETDMPAVLDAYAQSGPLPEQLAINRETAVHIRAAILQLPPHYRAVIELRHFQDLSYDEMVETLERSLSNVKSDLYRARKQLAELLGEG